MKKLQLLGMCLSLLLVQSACDNGENQANKMADQQNDQNFKGTDENRDVNFATTAAVGGMFEVDLGKLAMANASSQAVKDFGSGMVTDHSKANEELKAVALAKNIALPATLDNEKQKMINELATKRGADFDKAYMDLMVDDHKEDIDDFQKEADKGNDADLKTWAAGNVPTLQHHLHMAEEIQQSLKK